MELENSVVLHLPAAPVLPAVEPMVKLKIKGVDDVAQPSPRKKSQEMAQGKRGSGRLGELRKQ